MNISIASDHAGFEQKQALVDYLAEKGHEVIDRGPDSDDRVDYPDYAALVAHDVADGTAERGVLVCGTGIGMAVAANKVRGIRAANVTNARVRRTRAASTTTRTSWPLSGRFVRRSRRTARILDAFLLHRFRRRPSCRPRPEDRRTRGTSEPAHRRRRHRLC